MNLENEFNDIRDALERRFQESARIPGEPLLNLNRAMKLFGLREFPTMNIPSAEGSPLEGVDPSFKNLSSCGLTWLRAQLQTVGGGKLVADWAEKLLRWFEIRRREAWRLARNKWETKLDAEIGLLELRSFFLEFYFHSRDERFVNAALKFDSLPLTSDKKWIRQAKDPRSDLALAAWHFRTRVLLEAAMLEIARWDRKNQLPKPELSDPPTQEWVNAATISSLDPPRVCIFSPNPYSLFTIIATELLCRAGVKVEYVFVRRLLNPKRVWFEYRRDGKHLFKKIWRKLLFRRSNTKKQPFETMLDYLERLGIRHSSIDDLAKDRGIDVLRCWNLNDENVVRHLRERAVDLVIFTGGGLVREQILANSGRGVLNVHPGIVPMFRGMDVMEWAILKDCPDWVGCTVHFMERGVDTGPYLARYRIDYADCPDPHSMLLKFEPILTRCQFAACLGLLRGELTPVAQKVEDGKQFFYLHPRFIELVERRMKENCKHQ